MADAATLAARFGIDIRTPEFWRASLDIIRADIDRYCASAFDRLGRRVGALVAVTVHDRLHGFRRVVRDEEQLEVLL